MEQMTRTNMVFGEHSSSGTFTTTKEMGHDKYSYKENVEKGSSPNTIKVFRFAKIEKADDWLSQRRKAGLDAPDHSKINSIAIAHRGGLRHGIAKQDPSQSSPFISVATDWRALHDASESSVRGIIEQAEHLVEFHSPKHYLFRPNPCSTNSLNETEWLYYDYPENIGNFLVAIYKNPYKNGLKLLKESESGNIPSNIPAHRTA